ncbi:hypothetical protein ACFWNN_05820 [Lentzea sp. NPDC058450]|uniref:hypothetical protein n=1 Tax=Lentzea sp. NPDC058450 TaxID=3346505 RepID=UPI0036514776
MYGGVADRDPWQDAEPAPLVGGAGFAAPEALLVSTSVVWPMSVLLTTTQLLTRHAMSVARCKSELTIALGFEDLQETH